MDKFELLLGITGKNLREILSKIEEIDKKGIARISLFLEEIGNLDDRNTIKEMLVESCIKEIPMVHIRNEMSSEELEFFKSNFNTQCFSIHENHFQFLEKWKNFNKNLFLELNYDNTLKKHLAISKIGGFCIDLSHFKASEQRNVEDYRFVMKYQKSPELFVCNHLNGYNEKEKTDLHQIESLKDFEYLKTLPKFILGKFICLECYNSIEEQLGFIKYLNPIIKKVLKDKRGENEKETKTGL